MNADPALLVEIEEVEGYRLRMYRDSIGLPTIGVGHKLTQSELTSGKLDSTAASWTEGLTEAEVSKLLGSDLATTEAVVNSVVTVPLTQTQFNALVSFAFNVGSGAFARSTLVKLLNAGDYASVPTQLRRWVYAAGQRSQILANRREKEIALWNA
jgi:lysozyme